MSSSPNPVKASGAPVASAATPIKVLLADSQAIFRVGIRKILGLEEDIRVVGQAENLGQTLAAAAKGLPDVILFEAAICTNPAEAVSEILKRSPEAKMIVLTPEADEEETIEYTRRGVRGIVTRAINPELLLRCIRKVAEGEVWLDNKGINWVIEAYRTQASQLTGSRQKQKLTDKELLIVSYVTQGLRNKEIAHEVGTTEQVVKNYLRKVYDKLGVTDRLELALYCVHHQIFKKGNEPAPAEAAPAEEAAPAAAAASS